MPDQDENRPENGRESILFTRTEEKECQIRMKIDRKTGERAFFLRELKKKNARKREIGP